MIAHVDASGGIIYIELEPTLNWSRSQEVAPGVTVEWAAGRKVKAIVLDGPARDEVLEAWQGLLPAEVLEAIR